MSAATIWTRLGIEPTQDPLEIRRAYARVLKGTSPEEDPAAFASLRTAYEQALRQARLQAPAKATATQPAPSAPAQPAADVAPATPPSAAAEAPSPKVAALNADMAKFDAMLAEAALPDAEALRAQLTACLDSRLLENVAVLFTFEQWLLGRLWQHRERAEPVFELAITRLKWRESRAGSPAATLVLYADHIRPLRALGEQHPRALRALTRPPQAARLWAQILIFRIDEPLQQASEALERTGTLLPKQVDRAALGWWRHYFTHPQPSVALLRLTAAALGALGFILGLGAGSSSNQPLLFASVGATLGLLSSAGLVALVWALQLIRYRFKNQWLRPWQRLGWAPASLLLCAVAGLMGASVWAAIIAGLLALGLIGWASVAAHRSDATVTALRLRGLVVLNVPLLVWFFAMKKVPSEEPTLALWISVVSAIVAFAVGSSRLIIEFRGMLAPHGQRGVRLALAALSGLGVWLLLGGVIEPPWTPLAEATVVALVLLQRTPTALGLKPKQFKVRYWAALLVVLFVMGPLTAGGFSPMRIGGGALLSGIVLTMLVCEWNEWVARRSASQPTISRAV